MCGFRVHKMMWYWPVSVCGSGFCSGLADRMCWQHRNDLPVAQSADPQHREPQARAQPPHSTQPHYGWGGGKEGGARQAWGEITTLDTFLTLDCHCALIKRIVHSKIQMLSSFTHPNDMENLFPWLICSFILVQLWHLRFTNLFSQFNFNLVFHTNLGHL